MSRLVTLCSLFLASTFFVGPVFGQESGKKLIHLVTQQGAKTARAETVSQSKMDMVPRSSTLQRSILDDSEVVIPKLNKAGVPIEVAPTEDMHALTSLQVSERKTYAELNPVVPNSLRGVEPAPETPPATSQSEADVKQASATPVSFESKVETTTTSKLLADTALVVVRPPFVQPYYPGQYTFMVQNVGELAAENVTLRLAAPEGVYIINVSPAPLKQLDQRVVEIGFQSIEGGQAFLVEVDIENSSVSTEPVAFEASVTQTAQQAFSRAAFNQPVQTPDSGPAAEVVSAQPESRQPAVPTHMAAASSKFNTSLAATSGAPPTELLSHVQSPRKEAVQPRTSAMPNAVGANASAAEPPKPVMTNSLPMESDAVNHNSVSKGWQGREQELANLPANQVSTSSTANPNPDESPAISVPMHTKFVKRQPVAEAEAETTKVDANAAPVGYALNTRLLAPKQVVRGQEEEYSIEIQNQSSVNGDDIVVQLVLPAGLDVTVLDRAAWYDRQNRKISWQLDSLASGQAEVIRYKAIANKMGEKPQSVTVGMQGLYQGQATSRTTVNSDGAALTEIPAGSIR